MFKRWKQAVYAGPAWAWLGLLVAESRYDEAIAEFKALLERNPNDNQGVRYLIAPLYQLKGDLQGTLREYEAYRKHYRGEWGDPHFHFNWGLVLFTAGRLEEATIILI